MSDDRTETDVDRLWAALLTERADRLGDTAKLLRTIGHLWLALGVTLLALGLTIVLAVLP